MPYQNGADMTADVDLTSDLDGSDGGSGYVANNGAPQTPPGTRVAGTEGAAVQTQREAAPSNSEPKAAPPAKAGSVRDHLTAAFKTQQGQPTDQQGQETAQGQQADAQGRTRNPDGTFAPAAAQEGQEQQQAGQQPPQAQAMPQGLPPAVATQFAQLPAETQQFVAATMEREAQNMQRYRGYDGIEQIIGAPVNEFGQSRRDLWAMNGVAPEQAMNQLFALSDFAGRDPESFVQWFASQNGIDLGVLAEGAPPVDPQVQALQNEVQRLNGQVQSFSQGQQQTTHNAIVNEIQQFATEAGQDGQPLRPHFEELGSAIMPFIQAVRAENPNLSNRDVLSQAYDRACWGTPAVRAKMQAATEAARLAGQRETAARARTAGASVTGGPSSGQSALNNAGDGSVRGILESQFAAS